MSSKNTMEDVATPPPACDTFHFITSHERASAIGIDNCMISEELEISHDNVFWLFLVDLYQGGLAVCSVLAYRFITDWHIILY